LGIKVTMTLPSESAHALIEEFERGKCGIMRVRESMATVDSSNARASDPTDEAKVKQMIVQSVGFREVDNSIRGVMIEWVATELRNHMDELVNFRHLDVYAGDSKDTDVVKARCTDAGDEMAVCRTVAQHEDGDANDGTRVLRSARGSEIRIANDMSISEVTFDNGGSNAQWWCCV